MTTWTSTSKSPTVWSPDSLNSASWTSEAKTMTKGIWDASVQPWQVPLPWQTLAPGTTTWTNQSIS